MPLFAKHCFGILLLASAIISCKKDNDPEKTTSGYGNISYFAKASRSAIKTSATKSGPALNTVAVNWSSASVYVEKIAFAGKNNSLLDTTIIVEKNLDIFGEDALAGVIRLPSGSYKDVNIKLFCKKSLKSELAFNFKGTFTTTWGEGDSVKVEKDSVLVGSSYPFEANLTVTDITIDPSDKYKVTFSFDLNKVLTGISAEMLRTVRGYTGTDNKRVYVIWKGGSADEPFYDQVIQNWQTVASVMISKE